MPLRGAVGGEEDSGMSGKTEAIKRLFEVLTMTLENIASAAPEQSEALDEISTRLSDVMTAIINGGSGRSGGTLNEAGPSSVPGGRKPRFP